MWNLFPFSLAAALFALLSIYLMAINVFLFEFFQRFITFGAPIKIGIVGMRVIKFPLIVYMFWHLRSQRIRNENNL